MMPEQKLRSFSVIYSSIIGIFHSDDAEDVLERM